MEKTLYEASITGNVQVLNALIQEDNLILDRSSLTSFNETPLHIAAMKGHLDFVCLLLGRRPALAMSLDSRRRTPLHLASAEGHVEIVRELLQVTGLDGCSFRDQDGRTPMHVAVLNERVEMIRVLVEMNPNLGREVEENGDTILHMCISYNRLEALKVLTGLWNEDGLATVVDGNGNTLLHLAVVHKQIQTVKSLLQKSSIRASGNLVNRHGLTPLDVLDLCPRNFETLEIQNVLMEANILRGKDVNKPRSTPFHASIDIKSSLNITDHENKPKGCMSSLWNWYLNNNGNWLEKQRGILILATIIVATSSFYSGLHPPGGTFTDSGSGPLGNAIHTEVGNFDTFVIQNTIIMVISMAILVVLLCGIPLRNKFCLWVLHLATLCIVFFVVVTYLQEIAWMSPDTWVNPTTLVMCFVWISLSLLFGFVHTIFFVIWVVKKLLNARRTRMNNDVVHV